MPKQMTAEQKLTYMTETPLPRLVLLLSVPTIVSMLITSFYNMADTYFVGLIGSASASGAVGVAFPLMAIMQAVGFMFGHGSGNHMARVLGAGDAADARKMASTGFFSAFFVGLAIMALGLLAADPLAYALGSTPTIAPYAKAYLGYLMPGAPFLIASLVLNNQLRFQGSAFYAMIGITSGAVLNIILDPVFIFTFGMGVAGAALATSLSQAVSFFLLLAGTRRGGNIRIRWHDFTPTLANFREILRGGVPSLARQGLNSLATVCLNLASGGYGDAAIAAMSIVTRVMMMAVSAIIGFGQGYQPVAGYNYGAKRYDRVREAFLFMSVSATVFMAICAVPGYLAAPHLIRLFIGNDADVVRIGTQALRFQCLTMALLPLNICCNMTFQTIGRTGLATFLSTARQGYVFFPVIFLLPRVWGLTGVEAAQPIADAVAFLICIPYTVVFLRELREANSVMSK